MKRIIVLLAAIAFIAAPAYAGMGDAKSGEMLFKDAKAFSGMKSCSECHPMGRGLEKSGMKMEFKIMGQTQKSLEEAVNFCIINANKGKAIAMDSKEMMDMVAYIKSLGKKSGTKTPGY